MATAPQAERLLRHAREYGFVRPRDLDRLRVPRTILKRLVDAGLLVRRSRGVYTVPEYEPTEHTDLAAVAKRAPKAIICLLSALRFHELTTQNPFEIWIMIGQTAWRPQIEHPPVRVIRASGAALTEGVDVHEIEGLDVRITAPAKTVADCFKYRSKVGTDVAVEALRDCWRQRKATMDEIYRFAKIDRVAGIPPAAAHRRCAGRPGGGREDDLDAGRTGDDQGQRTDARPVTKPIELTACGQLAHAKRVNTVRAPRGLASAQLVAGLGVARAAKSESARAQRRESCC